jgi:hypothetical protein
MYVPTRPPTFPQKQGVQSISPLVYQHHDIFYLNIQLKMETEQHLFNPVWAARDEQPIHLTSTHPCITGTTGNLRVKNAQQLS